jgi:hypothetical protein
VSEAISALSAEISELRQEQAIITTQVDELHRVVLADNI